jgi:hypothetical protein
MHLIQVTNKTMQANKITWPMNQKFKAKEDSAVKILLKDS